jgi:hypothetical protein
MTDRAHPSDHAQVCDGFLRETRATTLAIVLLDAADAGISAERTARDLHDDTNGVIDVVATTVRNWTKWYRDAECDEAGVA